MMKDEPAGARPARRRRSTAPGAGGGLDAFRDQLHPLLVRDIESWTGDPHLGGLAASVHANTNPRSFLNVCAEAIVARHVREQGGSLQFEVPTPAGRRCDFQVDCAGHRFFLHVKRIDSERPRHRRLTISSRLRVLERIGRPYVVGVRWQEGLHDERMQQFVAAAATFISRARIGDEHVVRDERGKELGGVRIVAPWEGTHVTLVIGLPSGFIDEAPRIRRLMARAYQQFMPRATNVILLCSGHEEDAAEVENALLGILVERWDAHPPPGRRVAHGRADDGFWHGRRRPDSLAAGWFHFDPAAETYRGRLWLRESPAPDPDLAAVLGRLFERPAG
ncbi:MAG: hypothetical protein ACYTGG_03960 [Planctomycetota bacterium]|jgi:hypothetical protein